MRRPALLGMAAAAAMGATSCERRSAAPAQEERPPDAVAAIGGRWIRAGSVASVAAAQSLGVLAAVERLTRDELLAQGAREARLDATLDLRLALDGLLARALLQQLSSEARRAPPSQREITAAVERRWLDLQRDESFRTVHAVVRVGPEAPEAQRATARELRDEVERAVGAAAKLAKETPPPKRYVPWGMAVAPDPAASAFLEAAKRVEKRGLELVAEELEPVIATGWTVSVESTTYDTTYVRAATGLAARGDVAKVDTPYGFHFIMLLERIPASVAPEDQRARLVWRDVQAERTKVLLAQLAATLRQPAPELPSNVDALLALAVVRR